MRKTTLKISQKHGVELIIKVHLGADDQFGNRVSGASLIDDDLCLWTIKKWSSLTVSYLPIIWMRVGHLKDLDYRNISGWIEVIHVTSRPQCHVVRIKTSWGLEVLFDVECVSGFLWSVHFFHKMFDRMMSILAPQKVLFLASLHHGFVISMYRPFCTCFDWL